MSDLSQQRWSEIERLLKEALEQPSSKRAAYLDQACGQDADLRAEVESFLDSHSESEGFLEEPALTVAARSLAAKKQSLIGAQIGPYRIVKSIGAGGMGEVYLAEDARLKRQIALKVLPAEFASDPGRVLRFEQEARAAGALNHPNVLVIHDTGVHNGLPYIASEYLQGETLRDRLNRGRIPLAKTLEFAIQLARALAAAHEAGIVHRDLKPENIFITSEGRIKILDFGIAKLTEGTAEVQPAMTNPGVIIGSVGYLSPEQVRGQQALRGSDLFAFGCVLYEMLTGQRAFAKDSAAETISAVLREEPPETPHLAQLPPLLVRTLRRCLEKSATERFRSAHDLAFTLEAIALPGTTAEPARKRPPYLAWAIAGCSALIAIGLASFLLTRKPAANPLFRFEIPIPGDPITGRPALAISPDGKHLAFMALGSKGKPVLWTRDMDATAPRQVPGSQDAQYPFWSADSRHLAFHTGDELKTLDITNGDERTIATIRGIVSGAWNADDVIVLGIGAGPLIRLQTNGEAGPTVTKINTKNGERSHFWPVFLPDNRHFLYSVVSSTLENNGIFAASLDDPEPKALVKGVYTNAMYAAPGYLLYMRQATVVARPFNASKLAFTGDEFPVANKLHLFYGYAAFSVSQTGTLIFHASEQSRFQLEWFDRSGKALGPADTKTDKKWSESLLPLSPVLSPDGTQLAMVQFQPSNGAYGIWVASLTRNLEFPATDTRNAEFAVWSPDGTRLAYSASPNGGARDVFAKRLDETGVGQLIYHSGTDKFPLDWSADGRTLLFLMNNAQGHAELWTAQMDGKAPPQQVPGTPADVMQAKFSPNGRWLAYASEQFGSSIIYVQDFPTGAMRVPISGKGGSDPIWSRDGHELFFLNSENELMSVPIEEQDGGGISAGTPKVLFKTLVAGVGPYSVTPDGRKFLMQTPTENTTTPAISVLVNRF